MSDENGIITKDSDENGILTKDSGDSEVKEEKQELQVKKENISGDLGKQIIRQIEYYFGDNNLPRDKFLQEQIKLDDGWVPLTTMLKFQRLLKLTSDESVILDALADSKLMEVSEDKLKIRRSPNYPLPVWNDERRKELMSRTLYMKGFPVENTTLDMLLDFFASNCVIENLQMRSYKDKVIGGYIFKGSVFVTFPTKEKAEEIVDNKEFKYKDVELIKKWQCDYLEEKRKEREERNSKKRGGEAGIKPLKREEEEKEFPKGAILHIKGLNADVSREVIKIKLTEDYGADIAFVDFNKGDEEGWVRLQAEDSAKEILKKVNENKLKLCDKEIEVRVLEGDEEKQFLEKTKQDIWKRRNQNKNNRRGGRRGGRGGFRGDRKRRGSPVPDATSAKISK